MKNRRLTVEMQQPHAKIRFAVTPYFRAVQLRYQLASAFQSHKWLLLLLGGDIFPLSNHLFVCLFVCIPIANNPQWNAEHVHHIDKCNNSRNLENWMSIFLISCIFFYCWFYHHTWSMITFLPSFILHKRAASVEIERKNH